MENLQRLYEIDDHPERRMWLDKLLGFMEERGTPISQCPTISKNPLDLYRLYMYTKDRGGFKEVGAGSGGHQVPVGFNNLGLIREYLRITGGVRGGSTCVACCQTYSCSHS